MSGVNMVEVTADEADLRLDRWFRRHYPGLKHGRLEKLLRTGQVRVDGKRAQAASRLVPGQRIRVPPQAGSPEPESTAAKSGVSKADRDFIRSLVIHLDDDVIALNKPPGLAVQGGTGTARHVDAMLDALRFGKRDRPRLAHRLDRDTSGVLLLARSAAVAARLGRTFKDRKVRKIYWALVAGCPVPAHGRIDLSLQKRAGPGGERMAGSDAGKNAVTLYRILETAGQKVAWVALWPLTGRTHQLRVHCAAIGNPIVGDGKYGGTKAFLPADAVTRRLHLHARQLVLPNPAGHGILDIQADLPPHMLKSWRFFEFDPDRTSDPFAGLVAGERISP